MKSARRYNRSIGSSLLSLLLATVLLPNAHGVAPSTPTISSVTESTNAAYGAGTVTVIWNSVTNATSYSAMLTKQGSSDTPTVITTPDATQLQATFRNLSGGTTYIVQVKAFTGIESSAWSANSRLAVPKTFPKAPAKPTVTPDIGKATIKWTALTADETGGYEVTSYLVTEINSSKTSSVSGSSTEALVTGLSNGSTVEFTVAALTAAGASGSTSVKSDKYTLSDVPSAPEAPVLATTTSDGELKSTWNAPTNTNGSDLISYTVKLLKDGADFLSQTITKIADTFYTFTGLLAGKYTSKVLATNGVGDSALSPISNEVTIGASASATPSATPSSSTSASPSATPSASPSASPSPSASSSASASPTPSPTETAAPSAPPISGGGGFVGGGGFAGGGALPIAVVPLVSPSPTPSPSASTSPSPSASASATASAAPTSGPSSKPSPDVSGGTSPSPKASGSPTPSSSSGPAPLPSKTTLPVIPKNSYVTPVQATASTKIVTSTSNSSTQTIKPNASISVALPAVKKGTPVTISLRGADGKIVKVQSTKTTKTGTFTLPTLQFKKVGTYTIIAKVGSSTKVITVKVKS